jgi:hypothetical protein
VSQIENTQYRLAEAADQNAQAFSDSLKMAEAMGIVLQRVLNEIVFERNPRHMTDGRIDFAAYMREYWLCMLMADFAAWCGKISGCNEPLIETATPADVHEFGG